jgi:L-asparaginase
MKKILVVFTGGTIGSSAVAGIINTVDNPAYRLLQLFSQHYVDKDDIEFDTLQPLQILSENLTPSAWEILINAIEDHGIEQYNGIIITHGTDTLAYTAAALSFYFGKITIPLFLVSSNYPLDHSEANGLENFIYAVCHIVQERLAGVFVPYRNNSQKTVQLHQGIRLNSSLQLGSDFISIANQDCTSPRCLKAVPPQLKPKFSEQVLLVRPYPALNYNHINLNEVKVVLHDLYHSGTACVEPFSITEPNPAYSTLEFIKRCTQLGIKVYISPIVESPDTYHSTCLLVQNGAQIIWNTTLEASYVKLLLAYGNFNTQEDIDDFINSNIAGEQIIDKIGVNKNQLNCPLCPLYTQQN